MLLWLFFSFYIKEKNAGCFITLLKNMLCNEKLTTPFKGTTYNLFELLQFDNKLSGNMQYLLLIISLTIAIIKLYNN